jgi:SAM-dependent methyltransferase
MSGSAPTVDLAWAVEEDMPPGPYPRDSRFIFRRVPELVTAAATAGTPGRVLDVACGFGGQLALLRGRGWEGWGLDASLPLVQHCRRIFAGDGGTPLVAGVAEDLPFRDASFDTVVCQGSIDHFTNPEGFLREVARVLKPEGRAVIGISNFDSLSCRLGRGLHRLRDRLGADVYRGRNYWQIPPNHTFRGTNRALRALAGPHLELVEARGISMLWLFNRWTKLIDALPERLAWWMLGAVDRIAYRTPGLADVIVSVWRPRKADDGRG